MIRTFDENDARFIMVRIYTIVIGVFVRSVENCVAGLHEKGRRDKKKASHGTRSFLIRLVNRF